MQISSLPNKVENLSAKVSSSVFWIFLFQILDNILAFIRLLILAHLLTPNDFGLVAIAWLTLQTINAFTETGIQQTLIHKTDISKYLNIAWTYLLFRGVILYIILFISAPWLGSFFHSTDSISIIRIIGMTLFIDALANIGTIFFQKEFSFDKQFVLQISGSVLDFIVAIGLALILKNVWALIYGSIANSIIKVILSYIISKYRPRLQFNWKIFNELNHYGKWIARSNMLQFIYSQGDDLLVGRILGTTSLGFYQLAYRISNLPATEITHIISTVLFPAYSKIQSDKLRISKIYLQVLQLTSFLSLVIGTIIICFAYDFTLLFLGEKWLPMVPSMQILTIWGIIRSIGATTGPVWKAIGEPKILTKLQIFQVIILVTTIYPLSLLWNITGTSISVVISSLIPNIIAMVIITKTLKIRKYQIFTEFFIPFIGSMIVASAFYYLRSRIADIDIIIFFILVLISLVMFFIYSVILHRNYRYTLYSNVFKLIKSSSNNTYLLRSILKIEQFLQ